MYALSLYRYRIPLFGWISAVKVVPFRKQLSACAPWTQCVLQGTGITQRERRRSNHAVLVDALVLPSARRVHTASVPFHTPHSAWHPPATSRSRCHTHSAFHHLLDRAQWPGRPHQTPPVFGSATRIGASHPPAASERAIAITDSSPWYGKPPLATTPETGSRASPRAYT